jgi:hypothetical protein
MRHLGALIILVVALATTTVNAQTPEAIKQRAAEMQKWRATFADPDPTVRLAALEAVLKGKDPSLRALAIDAALKTDDAGVQAAALLNIFAGTRTIIMESTTKGGLILTLAISKFEPATGSFQAAGVFRPQSGPGVSQCGGNLPTIHGQLTGLAIQFADNVCMGTLKYREGRFVGTVSLTGQQSFEGSFPVQ